MTESYDIEIIEPDGSAVTSVPDFLSRKELSEFKKQAKKIAKEVIKSPEDITISANAYNIGKESVDINTSSVSLIEQKIDSRQFDSSNLDQSLTEIKSQLDLINPSVVGAQKHPFKTKLLGFIPWTIKRLPRSEEIMSLINEKKDDVDDVITGLQEHLWHERDKSQKNAIELGRVCKDLRNGKRDLHIAIYQSQIIWEEVSKAAKKEKDDVRKNSLTRVVNDMSTATVDLQTVDILSSQTIMGAENLIHNSNGISKLVNRINDIFLPSIKNMLAVKKAAEQQMNVVSMSNAIMKSATNTIKQTAIDVNQTVVDTANLNSQSMVHVSDLQESCVKFEDARKELIEIFNSQEEVARKVSQELSSVKINLTENKKSSNSIEDMIGEVDNA